jgi:hypothetical protein
VLILHGKPETIASKKTIVSVDLIPVLGDKKWIRSRRRTCSARSQHSNIVPSKTVNNV